MENQRRNKLNEVLKDFNKKNKKEIFSMGSSIEELGVIPTSIPEIDKFIGGGFKRGGHTIIWGNYSIGKTALVLTTIANAQKEGLIVCYVNTEKPIDPKRFEFFGINLEELVYIEAPENAEEALEGMRTLCKNKVIDLFIIDSENGLCPKAVDVDSKGKERELSKKDIAALPFILSKFYNAVNSHVFNSRSAVIWVAQGRTKGIGGVFAHFGLTGGNAQEFYAFMIIAMRKDQKSNNPVAKYKEYFLDPDGKLRYKTKEDEIGFSVIMKLDKTNSGKSGKQNSQIIVPYYTETGFKPYIIPEETPITIDPTMSEEDINKVRDMLIEKGILNNENNDLCDNLDVISKEGEKELKDNGLSDESIKKVDKGLCDAKEGKINKPKSKRGRPKKKKD